METVRCQVTSFAQVVHDFQINKPSDDYTKGPSVFAMVCKLTIRAYYTKNYSYSYG